MSTHNSPHAIAYAALLATMQVLNEDIVREKLERGLNGELAVSESSNYVGRSTSIACENRKGVWARRK